MVYSQLLNTQQIQDDLAIIELKLGNAKIINHFQNVIHIINLENYVDNANKIEETLDILEKDTSIGDSMKITKLKLAQLKDKINTLIPFKRQKRGLFNGVGSVVKYITGNMDDNDARKLNSQIDALNRNDYSLSEKLKQQNVLNFKMMERFHNISSHINNEQDKISLILTKYQENFSNKINKEDYVISKIQYLNRINYNIDLLSNQITNIGESIVLAKLNITSISKFVLNYKEVEEIYNLVNNQITEINSIE